MDFRDFDLYCEEHDVQPQQYGEAFADWLAIVNGRPVPHEKVSPGEEQILGDRSQRELDEVPSFLALRGESD
jgi:hypothetical protein